MIAEKYLKTKRMTPQDEYECQDILGFIMHITVFVDWSGIAERHDRTRRIVSECEIRNLVFAERNGLLYRKDIPKYKLQAPRRMAVS